MTFIACSSHTTCMRPLYPAIETFTTPQCMPSYSDIQRQSKRDAYLFGSLLVPNTYISQLTGWEETSHLSFFSVWPVDALRNGSVLLAWLHCSMALLPHLILLFTSWPLCSFEVGPALVLRSLIGVGQGPVVAQRGRRCHAPKVEHADSRTMASSISPQACQYM